MERDTYTIMFMLHSKLKMGCTGEEAAYGLRATTNAAVSLITRNSVNFPSRTDHKCTNSISYGRPIGLACPFWYPSTVTLLAWATNLLAQIDGLHVTSNGREERCSSSTTYMNSPHESTPAGAGPIKNCVIGEHIQGRRNVTAPKNII